jgi:hypothetical protein
MWKKQDIMKTSKENTVMAEKLPPSEIKAQSLEGIIKEITPFFIHIVWPVAIIAIIAKLFAPLP